MKYEVPTDVELNTELVERLRSMFKKDRDNKFELFLLSSGIRDRYLDPKTKTYDREFKLNYVVMGLEDVFGQLPNFTKYSSCGDVIKHIFDEYEDHETYLQVLPLSVGCLYEISQILKEVDDFVFRQLFHYTPTRKSVDQDFIDWKQDPEPLIRSDVTEECVRNWFKKWKDPHPDKDTNVSELKVPFLTITCHKDLFEFNRRTGEKVGVLDLQEVEVIYDKINKIFEDHQLSFRVKDSMEKLRTRYHKNKKRSSMTSHLDEIKTIRQYRYM